MDINDSINKQEKILKEFNNRLDKLISEEEESDTSSEDFDGGDNTHALDAGNSMKKALDMITTDNSDTKTKETKETNIKTIFLNFGDPIEFTGDFDGKKIKSGASKAFKVDNHFTKDNRDIIVLSGKDNNLFKSSGLENVALSIKFPYKIDKNILNKNLDVSLSQKSFLNNEIEDLDSIVMTITDFK